MNVLNAKDLEWSKQHLPAATVPELKNAEEKDSTVAEPAIKPQIKPVACTKKVIANIHLP